MKTNFLMICMIVSCLFCSCTEDINIFLGDFSNANSTPNASKQANLILNVGDSNYGSDTYTTRGVVKSEEITASSQNLNKSSLEISLLYPNNEWRKGFENQSTSNKPVVPVGISRGAVYATTSLNCPYLNNWSLDKNFENGHLTLTSVKESDNIKGQYAPVPVTFFGNYPIAVSTTSKSSYTEQQNGAEKDWTLEPVNAYTKTAAISRNIQYATSLLKTKITFSDNIQVYSNKGDKKMAKMGEDVSFEITAINVLSSKSVTYREDFQYDCSSEIVEYHYDFKEPLLSDNGEVKLEDNYAHLTILPCSELTSTVLMECKITKVPETWNWYMLDYMWTNNFMGENNTSFNETYYTDYKPVKVGDRFYIWGTIKTDRSKIVNNTTNYLCPKNGSAGIFIPDVQTNANIHITNLCRTGVSIHRPEELTESNLIYDIDYNYGSMDSDWEIYNPKH